MNKKHRYLQAAALLTCLLSPLLIQGAAYEKPDYTEGIVYGKNVFIENDMIMIPNENTLVSGLIADDGEVYDLATKLTIDSRLYTVALDDGYLYLGTDQQLSKVPVSKDLSPASPMDALTDCGMYDEFEIYDGFVYYPHLDNLCRVSCSGGNQSVLVEGIKSYVLTTKGIFYITLEGNFCRGDLDGTNTELLGKISPDSHLNVFGDTIYVSHDDLSLYNLTAETLTHMPLKTPLDDFYDIIPMNDYFLYSGDDFSTYKYEFSTETETSFNTPPLPDESSRVIYRNHMYYSHGTGTMFVMNMANYQAEDIVLQDVLGTSSESDFLPLPEASGSSYDISSGLNLQVSDGGTYLSTDHFGLFLDTMDCEQGLWAWKAVSPTSMLFYYPRAFDAGYGGTVMSITAFDWGDNSYTDFPSYSIAGTSNEKIYVAHFPTDVQYDPSDSIQAEEYEHLYAYARRIDANANPEGNPFFTMY